jgi:hypothetical protein
MSIPETPCPEGGLVPWCGGIWPIIRRFPHPVLRWTYTIHEKSRGLAIYFNVSQADIVRAMEEFAQFKLKQAVHIRPTRTLFVQKRRWDFKKGTMWYLISDGRKEAKTFAVEQQALIDRIKRVEEEAA